MLFLYSTMEWRSCNAGIIWSASETLQKEEIRVWSSSSLHVWPRRRHISKRSRQPDWCTVESSWWIRCPDDCQDDTSLSGSQVNSGRCSVAVGFFRLDPLRRNYEETMRHWTRRITFSKVGQVLNASNAEINKDFLHEDIRGICWLKRQAWPRVNLHLC